MTDPTPRRIFVIGFNKCGTTSFHEYFQANGISSVHWRGNTLALALHENLAAGRPPLQGKEDWTAYMDMICIPGSPWGRSNSDHAPLIEGCRYFRELHRAYPDALFILNTRHPADWVQSRLRHDEGRFATAYLQALSEEGVRSREGLERRWLEDWDRHHAEAAAYFESAAPEQFLVFHIAETPAERLNEFLEPHFRITHREFPHRHQSAKRGT